VLSEMQPQRRSWWAAPTEVPGHNAAKIGVKNVGTRNQGSLQTCGTRASRACRACRGLLLVLPCVIMALALCLPPIAFADDARIKRPPSEVRGLSKR